MDGIPKHGKYTCLKVIMLKNQRDKIIAPKLPILKFFKKLFLFKKPNNYAQRPESVPVIIDKNEFFVIGMKIKRYPGGIFLDAEKFMRPPPDLGTVNSLHCPVFSLGNKNASGRLKGPDEFFLL
jgi:hypothetical protein